MHSQLRVVKTEMDFPGSHRRTDEVVFLSSSRPVVLGISLNARIFFYPVLAGHFYNGARGQRV
jgi:hypothetical protein